MKHLAVFLVLGIDKIKFHHELAALFSRYVHVTVQISDEEMYQVAGRYAP